MTEAEFTTHLDGGFPWLSGPEDISEQLYTRAANTVQATVSASRCAGEEESSQYDDYIETVRRYVKASEIYLESKLGDNEA
jgi:hypothetical protein